MGNRYVTHLKHNHEQPKTNVFQGSDNLSTYGEDKIQTYHIAI
jgi:hypothetical protein